MIRLCDGLIARVRTRTRPANRTAVSGIEFEALSQSQGTLLRWRTEAEISNLGFNIYREDNGVSSKVNPSLIGGSVFLVGPQTSLSQGREYQWKDPRPAGPTTRYWLEAVDLNGTTDRFEPEVVLATPESESANRRVFPGQPAGRARAAEPRGHGRRFPGSPPASEKRS